MKLGSIVEARPDTLHTVLVPLKVQGEDGQEREDKLKLSYLPLTTETWNMTPVEVIVSRVKEWDLELDEGGPAPITAEFLNRLPLPFIHTIVEAMTADFFPAKKK